ncbi:hypothetical protein [Cellvibrio sp. UBA7671]|uniref:hypothetical protein n=1 Tax=Cellvibrio sp. UBA7671 TaxID=1946312 RepID=UPI002F35B8BE
MYKPNELKETIDGVYKRYPKLSTHTKSLANWGVSYSKDLDFLTRYARGEEFFYSHMSEGECRKSGITYKPDKYTSLSMMHSLHRYSIQKMVDSCLLCFTCDVSWLDSYKETVVHKYWSDRLELEFYEFAYQQFLTGERPQKLSGYLRHYGVTLGLCLSLGWLDYARDFRDRINSAFAKNIIADGGDSCGRRRTQHFLVRLLNAYDGVRDVQEQLNIKCAYDVDIFNELVKKWNTNNLDELKSLLLKICDRHTHQCRHDSWNSNRFYDFENFPLEYYNPFEVLSVFRLRSLHGLDNPSLQHPLMQTHLAQLHPLSDPFIDDFLGALLKRARNEESIVASSAFKFS